MSRVDRLFAPAATTLTLAAVLYLLLADQGWLATERWILAALTTMFVAVAFSQAAALAKRGLPQSASILLWSALVSCAYFLMFTVTLIS